MVQHIKDVTNYAIDDVDLTPTKKNIRGRSMDGRSGDLGTMAGRS